jgi:hypothetical protein
MLRMIAFAVGTMPLMQSNPAKNSASFFMIFSAVDSRPTGIQLI